jgi:hypothetical protein
VNITLGGGCPLPLGGAAAGSVSVTGNWSSVDSATLSQTYTNATVAAQNNKALALASVVACDDPADEAALIAADQAAEADAASAPIEPAHGTQCDADDHLAPPPGTVDQAELARGLGVTDLAAAIAPDGFPRRGPLLSPSEMESFKPLAAPLPGPSEGLDQPDVPIYVGQYVQRAYYQASLRILRVCDANGTGSDLVVTVFGVVK